MIGEVLLSVVEDSSVQEVEEMVAVVLVHVGPVVVASGKDVTGPVPDQAEEEAVVRMALVLMKVVEVKLKAEEELLMTVFVTTAVVKTVVQ